MRIWTVQPLLVWERVQSEGCLTVDPSYFLYGNAYIPWQYEWIARQLPARIPGYEGHLPWWAYCEEPDLLWVRHHLTVGTAHVRIELQVSDALAIPCWAWDVVHCGHYLAATRREQTRWQRAMRKAVPDVDEWPLREPWRSELEASWLRVFDPDFPRRGWTEFGKSTKLREEAVFETLRLSDVRSATHFVGTNQKKRR